MDLDQLRQFDAVATYGTISAAADELRMPQPTLSRSLQRLEQELGHQLLSREGRHVELNEAGRLALEYIRPMLRDERLMHEALDRLSHEANVLRIGTIAPAPLWHLASMIAERFPGVMISSETIDQPQIERRLFTGSIGLAICLEDLRFPAFCSCHLMDENLFVVLSEHHPLANATSVTFHDLDGETFQLFNDIGFWRGICDRHLPHSRFIVQEDRQVFIQMLRNPSTIFFTTDAPQNDLDEMHTGHVVVPISDDDAHASFRLLVRTDGDERATRIFDWVRFRCRQDRDE